MKALILYIKKGQGGVKRLYIYPVILLSVILLLILLSNRSKPNGSAVDFGGTAYATTVSNGITWMIEDLALDWTASFCLGGNKRCRARFYTFRSAQSACLNSGGRLPSIHDWNDTAASRLHTNSKNSNLSARQLYYAFTQSDNRIFNIQFRGRGEAYSTESASFSENGRKGYYWTEDGQVAVFNTQTQTLIYETPPLNALNSCRCIR